MFAKLIAFVLLIFVSYILSVFAIPETADRYGNPEFNTWIRTLKTQADTLPAQDPRTLVETIKNSIGSVSDTASGYVQTTKQVIDETKKTYDTTKQVIDEKVDQVNKAADSVKKAYDAVNDAKDSIQNLSNFTGKTR